MKDFTALFQAIDSSTKTNDKTEALLQYFRQASEQDKVWTIALLSGNKPKRPVSTSSLREWAAEYSGLPLWLIEESYYIVGDLAETLSLILPAKTNSSQETPSLSETLLQLKELLSLPEAEKKAVILSFWAQGDQAANFVFNKLITGNFRMGLSSQLLIRALARYLQKEEKDIAHQLMGKWDPGTETMLSLFPEAGAAAKDHLPYPFFLAYPLEEEPSAALGNVEDWFFEKKYDGIRGQIIVRNGQVYVWSRGEELLTDKFPEFGALPTLLPHGTVIDGEIIPWEQDHPLPFAVMQTRIGRKSLSAKILAAAPLVMICYDLLEYHGRDIRNEPLSERRQWLAGLLAAAGDNSKLLLSPLVDLHSWEAVKEFRLQAREDYCEGLMIKKRQSVYETGRRRGSWWKWKTDPLTVDAVLIYAQSGSGRRANLYTDYTFAVWNEGQLIPVAKAYSGLTDKEIGRLDAWIKKHTLEKFGPVRSVQPELVFEIAFEGINRSTRHKSGVALRFPRILRWREDKPATEANTLQDLQQMLDTV